MCKSKCMDYRACLNKVIGNNILLFAMFSHLQLMVLKEKVIFKMHVVSQITVKTILISAKEAQRYLKASVTST